MTNWRDIVERAIWTFVQAFLATVTTVPLLTDLEGWSAVALAGSAAGVGAVLSFLKTLAQERLSVPETRATFLP